MVCPKCKNRGFTPTVDAPRPLINIGGKLRFATLDTRRYVCVQCGHAFVTKEVYYRDLDVRTQPDLFTANPSAEAA